jgi:hypothetical protein
VQQQKILKDKRSRLKKMIDIRQKNTLLHSYNQIFRVASQGASP